jgi:uncharacterized membrane protein SpoIIM required for sporulation
MIVDLQKFLQAERPHWEDLEAMLEGMEKDAFHRQDLPEIQRFYYLYQRASSDLTKMKSFACEPELRNKLENLVSRAYAELHSSGRTAHTFSIKKWLAVTLPRTFRRHFRAFLLSVFIFVLGGLFGGGAIIADPEAKSVLLPFGHLRISPTERVQNEESLDTEKDPLQGNKQAFFSYLTTHNTRVSIFMLATGMTWAIGTILLLFYNGVILGAVAVDYLMDGQWAFLFGWLLPHGIVEIPAILIAGQTGCLIGATLLGLRSGEPLRIRFRQMGSDIVTLICGVALMLVWAGFIEAFLSQYHEPVIPYGAKISFGVIEGILLITYFSLAGRKKEEPEGLES